MKNSTKSIIAVGIGGVAVGALLGVLFAPAEGKKTRAAIKSKTTDFADEAKKKAHELTTAAKDKATEIANSVSEIDPQEILENLKSSVETKYKSGKSEVKQSLLAQIQKLEEVIKKA